MEPINFDRLTKALSAAPSTRRAALGALAGGLALLAQATGGPETASTKKRKKRCIKKNKACDPNVASACCSGEGQCCLPYDTHGEGGDTFCAGIGRRCCPPAAGGGSCAVGDQCCSMTPRYLGVNDGCESIEGECCDDAVGGSCGPGLTCCVNPQASPQYTCCPKAAGTSSAAARATHTPRNFRPRGGASRREAIAARRGIGIMPRKGPFHG